MSSNLVNKLLYLSVYIYWQLVIFVHHVINTFCIVIGHVVVVVFFIFFILIIKCPCQLACILTNSGVLKVTTGQISPVTLNYEIFGLCGTGR